MVEVVHARVLHRVTAADQLVGQGPGEMGLACAVRTVNADPQRAAHFDEEVRDGQDDAAPLTILSARWVHPSCIGIRTPRSSATPPASSKPASPGLIPPTARAGGH